MSHTLTVTEQYATVVEAEDAADVTVVETPVSVSIVESDVSVDVTSGVHGDELHDTTVASLVAGKVPVSELGAGSPGSTTFLRGDQSWQVPAGGGGGAPTDATYVTTSANGTLSDEVLLSAVSGKGTLASRPAAGMAGRVYYVTDSGSQRWTRDTGSAWEDVADSMNQLVAPTASVSLNSQRITSLATPIASSDAATKAYADAIVQGLDWKGSVKAATTANITLSGTQTIDGVALIATDRVLVKNQTTGANNGIYDVAAGAWTRSIDADGSGGSEVNAGMATFVEQGTLAVDTAWVLTTNNPVTLGTTALVFTQFSGVSGGAPTDATYITQSASGSLSAEQALNSLTDGILKHTSGVVARAVPSTDYYVPSGTDVSMADGGTGASLVDPGADRMLFWDDSAGTFTWLIPGTGLTITGVTIDSSGSGIEGIFSVKNYGTTGTADDSSIFATALTAAAGGMLYVPPGTYIVTNLVIPANTTLWLARGAVLQLKASSASSSHLLELPNAGARVLGPGALDGNRANQSNDVMPVYITADDCVVDGVRIYASNYHGVHAQTASRLKVTNCYITDVKQTGINVDNSASNESDIEISFNRVDNSAEPAATAQGDAGIFVYSDTAGGEITTDVRIIGNRVILPTSPTNAMAPIVTTHVRRGTITGNNVSGGSIGISLDANQETTVTGNTSFGASLIGLEAGLCVNCVISDNTVDGNGICARGITATFPTIQGIVITGNTIRGCTERAVAMTSANYSTFSGNHITHTAATAAAEFTTMQHFTITNNVWYGGGTGVRAILLSTSDRCTISNNSFYNFVTDAIRITFTTAVVVDLIAINGNVFETVGTAVFKNLSGGATMGSRVTIMNNPGYHATYTIDVTDFNLNVMRASGAGTPEAALIAGIGSTFQRNNGGASTSFYIKETGTGNTGWRAV